MAKAKESPLWAPMFSLPNVHVKFPIDVNAKSVLRPHVPKLRFVR